MRRITGSERRRTAGKAGLILTGGIVHTLDAAETAAAAVAVRGGRILAVGTDAEIERLAGPHTARIALAEATVLPGLVDSHLHVADIGRMSRLILLFGARSIAEICERLKERASRTAGPVIGQGGNFHAASLAEGRLPTAADLDRVATDRPVMIGDVSKSIVNSFVLKGIDARNVPPGGQVLKDRNGRPLGIFLYAAKGMTPLAEQFASGGTQDPLPVAAERGLRICAALGLTGVLDAGAGLDLIAAFRSLQERKTLPIRVTMMPWETTPRELDRIGASPGAVEGRLTFGPIKLFSGCFLMHKTALMYEPFEGEPGNRGTVKLPPDEMQRQIDEAFAGGWPVGIHLAGDREIDLAASQIERGVQKAGGQPGRSHLIHAYFPRDKALSIAERLGLAWAVHPDFVRVWGDAVREFVGDARAASFTPMRTLLDRGLITGGGSDAPIIWPNPWLGIHAAVTRKTAAGRLLGEDQRITVREALHCYTAGSVGVFEQERERGSSEPGKLADLTVIDRDILAIDPEEIPNTRVLKTIVGGEVVYSATASPDSLNANECFA